LLRRNVQGGVVHLHHTHFIEVNDEHGEAED